MMDNVIACRERLYKIWNNEYETICKKEVNKDCCAAVRFILDRNIVCGNALSLKAVDDNGKDTNEYIIFSEWSFVTGNMLQRKDYRFDKLLEGEYEPTSAVNKKQKKKSQHDDEQMSLFSESKNNPSDEGEFLTSYIADYRRIQDYGK